MEEAKNCAYLAVDALLDLDAGHPVPYSAAALTAYAALGASAAAHVVGPALVGALSCRHAPHVPTASSA